MGKNLCFRIPGSPSDLASRKWTVEEELREQFIAFFNVESELALLDFNVIEGQTIGIARIANRRFALDDSTRVLENMRCPCPE